MDENYVPTSIVGLDDGSAYAHDRRVHKSIISYSHDRRVFTLIINLQDRRVFTFLSIIHMTEFMF